MIETTYKPRLARRSVWRKFGAAAALVGALGWAGTAGAQSTNPKVALKTSQGEIQLELYPDKAPETVANFLKYVDDGFYDNTIFHRVINGFMVQGGGFGKDMKQKETRGPIKIESKNGLKNETGTIAMARTADPNSATAQFFINVKDNAMLDHPKPDGHGYTVFGKVIKGMDTVDKIKAVATTRAGPHSDVPAEPIIIESARRIADK
jgi:peptidyl-prolyl cis-trans isomerase A (cyclophilin A)